jgi:hypothetical protein
LSTDNRNQNWDEKIVIGCTSWLNFIKMQIFKLKIKLYKGNFFSLRITPWHHGQVGASSHTLQLSWLYLNRIWNAKPTRCVYETQMPPRVTNSIESHAYIKAFEK